MVCARAHVHVSRGKITIIPFALVVYKQKYTMKIECILYYRFNVGLYFTGISTRKMTITLSLFSDRPAFLVLMNGSKQKHENKISNAHSNPLYQTQQFIGLAMDSVQISAAGIMYKIYAN